MHTTRFALALLVLPAAAASASAQKPASGGTLAGRVTDRASGIALGGAAVCAPRLDVCSITDLEGRYLLSELPVQRLAVVARRAGTPDVDSATVDIAAGDTATHDFTLAPPTLASPSQVRRADSGATPDSAARSRPSRAAVPIARVRLEPTRAVQGRLVAIDVAPLASALPPVRALRGSFSDQPLHFRRDGDRWRAIAGVPIGASDALALELAIERADGRIDTMTTSIAVARGDYRREQLSVAPRFGSEPDAAVAARIARENEQARAIGLASHDTPRLWRGPWQRPRPGRITSAFGTARTFNGAVQSRHMGTDFAGAPGAPIRAAARGVVRLVADFYYAGRAVYIDHGDGLTTGYFHLGSAGVNEGDTVRAGQIIGRVGSTGRVTGPHLHWVMRYGSTSVDPTSIFTVVPAPPPARRAPARRTATPARARPDSPPIRR